jgi:CRISPR system Cascade subunit CasE
MTLYFSRLQVSCNPAVSALGALIQPGDAARLMDANHRLIWSAFAGDPDASRDFLWRAESKGVFHVLSQRQPQPSPFFETPEVKAFAPALAPGDRLHFLLRANATRERKRDGQRSQRVDIVMDALFALGENRADRAAARMPFARREACAWLARQGDKSGFALTLDEDDAPILNVADYSVLALPGHRGRRRGQPQFGILDLTGSITVTDPAAFVERLAHGFGRAKSFGCGLMMVRRDRSA